MELNLELLVSKDRDRLAGDSLMTGQLKVESVLDIGHFFFVWL